MLPDGSKIALDDIEDCAHFVSCCLGKEAHESGGGLAIPSDFNTTYGRLSADRLFNDMKSRNMIDVVGEKLGETQAAAKLSQLSGGDLIFYWDTGRNRYGHVGLYMGDAQKRIACHTYCRCDRTSDAGQEWNSVNIDSVKYTVCKVRDA